MGNEQNRILLLSSRCHDCGAKVGEYHDFGCDVEDCPKCHGQFISCACSMKAETYRVEVDLVVFDDVVYHRIPFINVGVNCAICREVNPRFFNRPTEEWQKYVIPTLQKAILCEDCYNIMKKVFPNGWVNAEKNQFFVGIKNWQKTLLDNIKKSLPDPSGEDKKIVDLLEHWKEKIDHNVIARKGE